MSKGSRRRPSTITKYEEELRWDLLRKDITPEQKKKILKELDKIKLSK